MSICLGRTCWWLRWWMRIRGGWCICRRASGWITGRGQAVSGGKVVVVDAPVDAIPVWVRAGAVIPKIPEDVMTLVPQSESGNTTVKSLDDRRVYELNDDAGGSRTITDFEGRVVVRSGEFAEDHGGLGGADICAVEIWVGEECYCEWLASRGEDWGWVSICGV
jgi:hypothetical protein